MPEPIAGQIDHLLGGQPAGAASAGPLGGIGKALGGMFGGDKA